MKNSEAPREAPTARNRLVWGLVIGVIGGGILLGAGAEAASSISAVPEISQLAEISSQFLTGIKSNLCICCPLVIAGAVLGIAFASRPHA